MLNTSLIEILRCLSKDELKRFEELVSSPFYNKKSAVINLFKNIKKYSPDFKSEKLNREILWISLFPDKKYNYGVMKNLIYDLSKLSETYLQLQIFEANYYKKQFYLLENLNNRSSKKLFSTKFRLFEDKLKKQKTFTSEIYKNLRDLNILDYDYHFKNVSFCKDKDLTYKIAEYEIYHYLIECFKNYNNIAAFKLRNNYSKEINIIGVFLDKLAMEDILNEVKELSEFDFTILNTYYLMYLATKHTDDPVFYYRYKSFLLNNDHYFDDGEKRLLYSFLENTLTLNDKIADKHGEFFEIDRIRIDRKIILDANKDISFNEFTGIIQTAGKFGEIEFLKTFIKNYLKNVPEPVRKLADNFASANLHYSLGEFERSLEFIHKFEMNSSQYNLNLRTLKIKILYDLNDFLSFEYTVDSVRHYLAKEIIHDSYKQTYLNFCTLLNKLFKVREFPNSNDLILLKKEILKDNTANKSWMLEKIKELEYTRRKPEDGDVNRETLDVR